MRRVLLTVIGVLALAATAALCQADSQKFGRELTVAEASQCRGAQGAQNCIDNLGEWHPSTFCQRQDQCRFMNNLVKPTACSFPDQACGYCTLNPEQMFEGKCIFGGGGPGCCNFGMHPCGAKWQGECDEALNCIGIAHTGECTGDNMMCTN